MSEMDAETEMSRTEVATFFRELAEKLEGRETSTGGRDENSPIIGNEEETTTDRERATTPDRGAGETMTVIVGDESATVVLPDRMLLDVEVGSNSGILETGTGQRVKFELAWEAEEVPEDDSIEVV